MPVIACQLGSLNDKTDITATMDRKETIELLNGIRHELEIEPCVEDGFGRAVEKIDKPHDIRRTQESYEQMWRRYPHLPPPSWLTQAQQDELLKRSKNN